MVDHVDEALVWCIDVEPHGIDPHRSERIVQEGTPVVAAPEKLPTVPHLGRGVGLGLGGRTFPPCHTLPFGEYQSRMFPYGCDVPEALRFGSGLGLGRGLGLGLGCRRPSPPHPR